jgi:glucose-1-phosphate thymidylyltransferase
MVHGQARPLCVNLVYTMKCLILAGGFGTRLYPLIANKSKALLEYKGKPLLSHLVDKVPRNIDVLVSTNLKYEADFRRWQQGIDREIDLCIEAIWSEKQKKGAVSSLNFWVNTKNISQDLLVLAGDNYFEFDLSQFIAAYDGKTTLVAVHDIGDRSRAGQFGVVRLDGDRLSGLEEKPTKPASSLIATACYIFPPSVFPILGQYCSGGKRDNLGSFISHLIETDRVHGYLFSEPWFDIGSNYSSSDKR